MVFMNICSVAFIYATLRSLNNLDYFRNMEGSNDRAGCNNAQPHDSNLP